MLICSHCGTWLSSHDEKCPGCKRPTGLSLFAPAVEGPVIRPSGKPKIVRGDDG